MARRVLLMSSETQREDVLDFNKRYKTSARPLRNRVAYRCCLLAARGSDDVFRAKPKRRQCGGLYVRMSDHLYVHPSIRPYVQPSDRPILRKDGPSSSAELDKRSAVES